MPAARSPPNALLVRFPQKRIASLDQYSSPRIYITTLTISKTEFSLRIPLRKQIEGTRKEGCFHKSKEEPSKEGTSKVVRYPSEAGDGSPDNHTTSRMEGEIPFDC
jgi:hypothetical protein